MKKPNRTGYIATLIILSGSLHAEEPVPRSAGLRLGPVYRGGMNTVLRGGGGSRSQEEGLTGGTPYRRLPAGPGNPAVYADRDYDNGYVYQDAGTGNPMSLDPNTTWFWGYDDASQLVNGQLAFTGGGGAQLTREVQPSGGTSDDQDLSGWGLEISGTRPLRSLKHADLDLLLALRGFWNLENTHRNTPHRERITERRFDVIDLYDVAGTLIPPAPHLGSFDGPFDDPPVIPSPLIPNLPGRRLQRTRGGEVRDYSSEIRVDVDADIWELRAGPMFSAERMEGRLRLHAAPTLSLLIVQSETTHSETWGVSRNGGEREVLQSWRDRNSETDFAPGIGLQVGIDLGLNPDWALSLHGSVDHVRDVNTGAGPSRVKLELGGYSAGIAIVRMFGPTPEPAE